MEKLELRFTYEKETRNTIRYQEELGEMAHSSRDIAVGSLYVQKECLGDPPLSTRMTASSEVGELASSSGSTRG